MSYKTREDRMRDIEAAIKYAKEFIDRAERSHMAFGAKHESTYHSTSFAAAKRASMDLTRSLAKMRGRAA